MPIPFLSDISAQSGTFAGDVQTNKLQLSSDTEHFVSFRTTSLVNTGTTVDTTAISGRRIDLYAYDDIKLRAGTSDSIFLMSGGSDTLTLDNSNNATFEGNVSLAGNLNVNSVAQHHEAKYSAPKYYVSFDRTSSSDQYFKIITNAGGPKRIRLNITSSGDNTNTLDTYYISQSGYNMQSHIFRLPGSRYNQSKLVSVLSINPSAATQEVWIKLLGMNSGTGTTTVTANVPVSTSSAILASATTTKPTLSTGDSELEFVNTDRNNYTTMSSAGAKFGGKINVGTNNEVEIVSSGFSLFPSIKVNNNGHIGSASVTDALQFKTSGYLKAKSRLAVGSTDPEFALHLSNNAGSGGLNSGVMLEMRSSTITDPAGMRFVSQTGGATNYMQNLYDGANLKWKHWNGSAYVDKITFSNSGAATFAGTIASGAITVTGGSNQTVIDADIAFDLTDGSKDTLLITNDKTTSAIGAIGPSIGFGNMNSDRRTSAIGAIRTGADHDNMGLAFFTHPSDTNNETIVKQLELAHDGTATFSGDVITDKIKGRTYPSNSFLDFDYDQTASSNTTALTSIARINYIADTNGNDGATSAGHVFYTGTTDIDTATQLLSIKNNGDAIFSGTVTATSFSGDGANISNIYKKIYEESWSNDPNAKYIEITLPFIGGSGGSDYYYFDVLGYRDIGVMDSQLHYRVYLHNRANGVNNNDLNADVFAINEAASESFSFGFLEGGASTSKFLIKVLEDYSRVCISTYPSEATLTSSMISSTTTEPSGYTDVTFATTKIKGNIDSEGDITISKTDPTITLIDTAGANTDPNGKIIFSEVSGTQNFDINYNGTNDRLEFRGRIGNNDNTDLVYINRDLTTTMDVKGGVIIRGNLTVSGTTTTLNTQTVEVKDNILQLNTTQGTPDTATATTSGISVYRGDGVDQASLIFDDDDDTWDLTNNLAIAGSITTNLSSAGTYFTGGSGGIRQLSITSGTNISAHALHTFNIASSNGKYEFDIDGTTKLSLDSSSATFAGSVLAGGRLETHTGTSDGALINSNLVTSSSTTTTVISVLGSTYTAAFFDYLIKNGTNVRAGTVTAVHDGTNVEFNETSTVDLGDTSDVTLSVDLAVSNLNLKATTTSSNWTIKSLVRAI